MLFKRNTFLMLLVFCSVTLWCKSASAGSSFLSPSQKPQNKGKSYRVGRHVMEEPNQPNDDKYFTLSAPFDIGIGMREEDFEEYVAELQEIIQHLLGNTNTKERNWQV